MKEMKILEKIRKEVKKNKVKKIIVFPEGEEPRIIKACKIIARKKYAEPILLGNEKQIKKKLGILYSRRIKVVPCLKDRITFGLTMVKNSAADGLIAGAMTHTADVLRPAFKIIGSHHKVSGVCILEIKKKTYFFADCGVIIDPQPKELANIAFDTAKFAKSLGAEPKIAMLSFSTHGSSKHEMIKKIKKATELAKRKKPSLAIDGELQVDAAIVPEVMEIKCPKSKLKGKANILIFPDLNSGNIGYKLAERMSGGRAVGPVLLGMKKPVNDLSRGCSIRDIVDLALITVFQSKQQKK